MRIERTDRKKNAMHHAVNRLSASFFAQWLRNARRETGTKIAGQAFAQVKHFGLPVWFATAIPWAWETYESLRDAY
jgi:hypothetical protein